MSFKEQLKSEILPKAVDYYNSGLDINSAIVKAAGDFNLNLDQTDRLLETMNTARVIAHYEKNASDRTANCDIADKDTVRKLLYGDKPQEKTASAGPASNWGDYACYFDTESNYRKPQMQKAAAQESQERGWKAEPSGLSLRQAVDAVGAFSRKMHDFRKFAEDRRGMVESMLATQISKIASMLSKGYEPEVRWALFKVACRNGLQDIVPGVEAAMPASIVKEAAPYFKKLARANVYDTSDISRELALAHDASEALSALEKIGEYIKDFAKREALASDVIWKQAELGKKAGMFDDVPYSDPNSGGGSGGDKGGKDDKKDKKDKKDNGKGNTDPWTGKSIADNIPNSPKPINAIYDYLRGETASADKIEKLLQPHTKPDTRLRDYVDNLRRSSIISELYSEDPVLSEASPEDVSRAYQALVQAAPEASLNKEIVRAILRQSVSSVAVSPFDAKQWADLDNALLKNRYLTEGKESRIA